MSIEDLRKYVKINASKDWDTYNPFVEDAQEKYIELFFGSELLDELESNDKLTILICRALAPFSLALASAELSRFW